MSSLGNQLRSKKGALRPTVSRVTMPDGRAWHETSEGRLDATAEASCPGFVVDTKPDLRVSCVADGVLVGSQDAAHDLDILTSLRVTHILNVATGVPNLFEGWFVYKCVEAFDRPDFDLLSLLDECVLFMTKVVEGGGRVLVHCNAGVSRSVSVVMAFLMRRRAMTSDEALRFVRLKRPFARPNEGFVRQLQQYEKRIADES